MAIITFNKIFIIGILIFAACSLVFGKPAEAPEEEMQNDYDYDVEDQSAPNALNKAQPNGQAKPVLPKSNHNSTVTGIIGKDIVLKCDEKISKDNVILWYHGKTLISNGNNLLLPNFSIDPSTFDLTIIKASPQSEGDYVCEILPQKSQSVIKVILAEHSWEAITPESSTSSQDRLNTVSLAMHLTAFSALFCMKIIN